MVNLAIINHIFDHCISINISVLLHWNDNTLNLFILKPLNI